MFVEWKCDVSDVLFVLNVDLDGVWLVYGFVVLFVFVCVIEVLYLSLGVELFIEFIELWLENMLFYLDVVCCIVSEDDIVVCFYEDLEVSFIIVLGYFVVEVDFE